MVLAAAISLLLPLSATGQSSRFLTTQLTFNGLDDNRSQHEDNAGFKDVNR